MKNNDSRVTVWEESIEIPTYPVGEPDKNPMFLEKRVYQGSSGKVYPYPVIDKIYDEKVMKKYNAVYLENDYLKIMIFPELGGRIQRAIDKTNNYDFVYYNNVIKPALVGLAGPWISGGIEFNWPQHHRPNTFGPVEYTFKENPDGSKSVLVSEVDRMYGTKGMAKFTLHPGKAYLEIEGQVYNRTSEPQTFLWWANPAVAVNDYTQSIFPPDVNAVFDHGKRDVSEFPIAKGTYYKMDYSAGVDISWYKNIPVPTSYMAHKSDFDFVGGYDHQKKAGILHIANHHVSPGKKQWTWGCGDFGKAWDDNLTDEDGPYIELMTGVYTDNQPDFTWLQPYEEKTFKQYFMPFKNVSSVKNSNIEAVVNLEVIEDTVFIEAYTTTLRDNSVIRLSEKNQVVYEETVTLSPQNTYTKTLDLPSVTNDLMLEIFHEEKVIISYKPVTEEKVEIPDAAKAIDAPELIERVEELYLAGLHLEQYRHATYSPEDYYLEGLRRSPEDCRLNNAYGLLLFRRGDFIASERYLKMSVKTITRHNPNPHTGEMHYNLGLCQKYLGDLKTAYATLYKATWGGGYQSSSYYALSQIDCMNQEFDTALEHINKSIVNNYHNCNARNLKTALLRRKGCLDEALSFAKETMTIDTLDFAVRYELFLIESKGGCNQTNKVKEEFIRIMRNDEHNYLTVALEYGKCGLYEDSIDLLQILLNEKKSVYPMVYYYMGYFYSKLDIGSEAVKFFELAGKADPSYCFPNTLEDLIVLEEAKKIHPSDAKVYYYIGILLYDKKQHEKAIENFKKSIEIDDTFPTVHRNMALIYYNRLGEVEAAKTSLERAFELDEKDSRVFLELDQLYKKMNIDFKVRLQLMEKHLNLVHKRDDLYIEYVTLHNLSGNFDKAETLLNSRIFHPWEGGEGKVTKQYVYTYLAKGKNDLEHQRYIEAIGAFEKALSYPSNLGEGKLAGAQENDIYYLLGCAYREIGEIRQSDICFEKAASGLDTPTQAMFYNDQPPEMIYYQGLSLNELGRSIESTKKFRTLIEYGKKHFNDEILIDYFAISLPDFLIFDENLKKRNQIHCYFLMYLGYKGMGDEENALVCYQSILHMENCHQGVISI